MFERLYGDIAVEIDGVAEETVGHFGPSTVDPNVTSSPECGLRAQGALVSISLLLENEQRLLELLDVLVVKAGEDNALQDLFQGIAKTHSNHCFLLRQRLG